MGEPQDLRLARWLVAAGRRGHRVGWAWFRPFLLAGGLTLHKEMARGQGQS